VLILYIKGAADDDVYFIKPHYILLAGSLAEYGAGAGAVVVFDFFSG
jgi:hypothetical protein